MSDKKAETVNKKSFSKVLKWGTALIGIIALELVAIGCAVKITESKNKTFEDTLQKILNNQQLQTGKIEDFNKIPALIENNAEKISANTGMVNLLAEGLKALKDEVGNKKMEKMILQISELNHRMESVEETKNQEALVLSLALIIKENALYNRHFSKEADILAELTDGKDEITSSVQEIVTLKNNIIPTDTWLIEQYNKVAESLIFEEPALKKESTENRSTVAKSIELIKDTVAGINFDKVVVLKKNKKNTEQQLMLNTLGELVQAHNFKDALAFVEENRLFFHEELNPEFTDWLNHVKEKVLFDKAISHIIASSLSEIRKDFLSKTVSEQPQGKNND